MLKQKRLVGLDREICTAEEELKYLNEQIRRAEISLEEKKKLTSSVCQALSDEKGSPRSTLVVGHIDATESPHTTEKAISWFSSSFHVFDSVQPAKTVCRQPFC
jgi:kinesin family protein C2/C3